MTMETSRFNAQELCSRKLWELVSQPTPEEITESQRREAISELATRRDYLTELERFDEAAGLLVPFTVDADLMGAFEAIETQVELAGLVVGDAFVEEDHGLLLEQAQPHEGHA